MGGQTRIVGYVPVTTETDVIIRLKKEIASLTADLTEAERLIARAVELMTPDQVGQWISIWPSPVLAGSPRIRAVTGR